MKAIILAMILMESSFNPKAYNKEGNAKGLGQITPIAAKEAHLVCGLEKNPNLFDAETNLRFTLCIYEHYRKTSRSDIEAVITYHAGYRGRALFRAGKSPGPKTSRYAMKVLHFRDMFKNKQITTKKACKRYKLPEKLCQN